MIVTEMNILKIIMKNDMETKQTAVEWIEKQLDWLCNDMSEENRIRLFNQAKQMEKEQIIDAHIYGDENHTFNSSKIEEYANDYYNETYGKEKS